MLLQEQMKQDIFSYNERIIVDFILEKQEKIKDYSTKMIGDEPIRPLLPLFVLLIN